MTIVVWEWENDANIYLPYSSEVSFQLEGARIANVKEVMLGGIDPYLETFKVNIPKMTQITTYNGRNRVVRRVAINPAHPFSRGSKWEWNFHHAHWFPYGTEVAKNVQEAFDGTAATIQLPNLLPGYVIDVRAMLQTNSTTGFQRKIRSVSCTPYRPHTSQPAPQPTQPTQRNLLNPALPRIVPVRPAVPRIVRVPQPAAAQPAAPQPAAPQPAVPRIVPVRPANKHRGRAQPRAAAAGPGPGPGPGGAGGGGASSSSQGAPLHNALQTVISSSCVQYKQSGTTLDVCSVCQNNVTDASDYTTSPLLLGLRYDKITLKCNHHLHAQCLHALVSASSETSSFRCPECTRSFGIRTGNQPTSGKMAVKVDNSMSLAGYEQFGTIIVTYSFTSGVQDGVSYNTQGFPRIAYFPDSDEGNDIVDLIKVAFKRRLIFTIGDSVTSGAKNCVVWNDIHHKTSTRRGDTYGYPDPGYLARVTAELKSKGVE